MQHDQPIKGCVLCDFASTADWLYEDEHWLLGPGPGVEQPGWIMAQLRRHVGEMADLSAAELGSFVRMVAKLSEAIKGATKAEKVYFIKIGENNPPHLHLQFVPRGDQVPAEHRGLQIFANRDAYRDAAATKLVSEEIRKTLSKHK
jgi:diadenosine tetraphosphate (Ap4A) HIT family hydrolase